MTVKNSQFKNKIQNKKLYYEQNEMENALLYFSGNTPEQQREVVTAFQCSKGFVLSFVTTVPTVLCFVQGLLAYISHWSGASK